MKKTYEKPETEVIEAQPMRLLAGSDPQQKNKLLDDEEEDWEWDEEGGW